MQIFPPLLTLALAQALPAPDAEAIVGEFLRLQDQFLSNMLPLVLISQAVAITAYWITSKIVAGEEGKFINAIKLWILSWLAVIGIIIVGAVALFLFFLSAQRPSDSWIFAGGGVGILLYLALVFGLPMKVYKISLPFAFLFVVIAIILNAAGNMAASSFVPSPIDREEASNLIRQYSRLSPIERKKLNDRLIGLRKSSPDELLAADRSHTIPERHAAIKRIYTELETRRTALKNDDKTALSAYQRDKQRYQELLAALQADAAAAGALPN